MSGNDRPPCFRMWPCPKRGQVCRLGLRTVATWASGGQGNHLPLVKPAVRRPFRPSPRVAPGRGRAGWLVSLPEGGTKGQAIEPEGGCTSGHMEPNPSQFPGRASLCPAQWLPQPVRGSSVHKNGNMVHTPERENVPTSSHRESVGRLRFSHHPLGVFPQKVIPQMLKSSN